MFNQHCESDSSTAMGGLTLCLLLCAGWGLSPSTNCRRSIDKSLQHDQNTVLLVHFMNQCYSFLPSSKRTLCSFPEWDWRWGGSPGEKRQGRKIVLIIILYRDINITYYIILVFLKCAWRKNAILAQFSQTIQLPLAAARGECSPWVQDGVDGMEQCRLHYPQRGIADTDENGRCFEPCLPKRKLKARTSTGRSQSTWRLFCFTWQPT